jgi:YegS/Rv2252/BmrU family lipid kinase
MIVHKTLFIINPKAGKKKKLDITNFIKTNFKSNNEFEIVVWENKDEFEKIIEYIFSNHFTIAVAVGGDGTVNKVASAVVNTSVALGILPMGSGNGLARSLDVSMNLKKALSTIAAAKISKIDSGIINGKNFFCTAGVGFDAHIGNLFATSTKRGLQSYIKIICREFFNYKSKSYQINYANTKINEEAFLITFANAGQYGNDFYIAPQADLKDGELTMCILKPFSIFRLASILVKVLRRTTMKSKYFNYSNGTTFKITSTEKIIFHFDGEPGNEMDEIEVKIVPLSLHVVC